MLTDAIRLFFRNKLINIILIAAALVVNIRMCQYSHNIMNYSDECTSFDLLEASFDFAFFLFVVILLCSYTACFSIQQAGIEEQISFRSSLRFKVYMLSLIAIIILCFCAAMLAWNIGTMARLNRLDRELLFVIIKSCLLYFFLYAVLACACGALISSIKGRNRSYACLLLVCFVFGPLPERIADGCSTLTNHLSQITDWFTVGPRQLFYALTDTKVGISTVPELFALTLLWILAICLILAGKKRRWWLSLSLLAGILVCAFFYSNAPWSNVCIGGSPKDAMSYLREYYELPGSPVRQEAADFKVQRYDMKFKVRNDLSATVHIYVDDTKKDSYHFTLYHQYHIKKVLDNQKNALDYTVDGDYLSVKNNGTLSYITVIYKGSAGGYYAYSEGIMLPSELCFYPVAGWQKIYDEANYSLAVRANDEIVDFRISVDAGRKVFCNLAATSYNTFEGQASSITLLAGYLKEAVYHDVTIVSPDYAPPRSSDEATIKATVDSLYEIEKEHAADTKYSVRGKTIFVSQPPAYPEYIFKDDHIQIPFLVPDGGKSIAEPYYTHFLDTGKNSSKILRGTADESNE